MYKEHKESTLNDEVMMNVQVDDLKKVLKKILKISKKSSKQAFAKSYSF